MSAFVLASSNKGKLLEMREILSSLGIDVISQTDAGLSLDVEETGSTFEENAILKAKAALDVSGLPSIADDSGLVADALGGAPGIYTARYGNLDTDEQRYNYLLKNMEGAENRRAVFVSVIACALPDGTLITARGECEGAILRGPRGTGGFGYDPVFEVKGTGQSMAELTTETKNRISHRARALRSFCDKLREYYANA